MKMRLLSSLCLVWLLSCGFAGPAPTVPGKEPAGPAAQPAAGGFFLIDNFENGNFTTNPVWWQFDVILPRIIENTDYQSGDRDVVKEISQYSLKISGKAGNWYSGGLGTYLAKEGQDLGEYNALQLDVFGNGPGSGTIKVELVDDDKGSWKVELDDKGVPLYNDLFSYNLTVDWKGWRRIGIPLSDFILENPGKGNGVLVLSPVNLGGGLLQIQFVFLGAKESGALAFNLDNIKLVKGRLP
jgi:hypothetical protein